MTENITAFFVAQQFNMSCHFAAPSNGVMHYSKEAKKI